VATYLKEYYVVYDHILFCVMIYVAFVFVFWFILFYFLEVKNAYAFVCRRHCPRNISYCDFGTKFCAGVDFALCIYLASPSEIYASTNPSSEASTSVRASFSALRLRFLLFVYTSADIPSPCDSWVACIYSLLI
jgi:hypothetical protein